MIESKSRGGRPRSEQAREAILHAVDDLLLEVGYAALTMKGIAERAGVGRQTVYRWWSTKAEIIFEASVADAEEELTVPPAGTPLAGITAYLEALVRFLAHSPAGIAYRTLLAAAQHDPAVAQLIASRDILGASAQAVLDRTIPRPAAPDQVAARLIGPAFYWIMSGRDSTELDIRELAQGFLRSIQAHD
ncbi:TetR/AcrR family transcriptional regulator [Plantactinospora sp. KBS50]|uniref:TetR/AcrR family transcriptional regulator n=1 Tax=Plantactinospora sp. KBS50 TaxID=2024580 RepID=UPI000BAB0472|nr:TetR/AcrR family transcriptional regulator [Plantactinospora sp. KBS50]ASW55110.1 TetR family transcriptional regulator [Plantactinospora sp. KBS50]